MPIASNYRIEPKLIKKIEKIAKIKGTDENQVLNDVIEKGIEKTELQKAKLERLKMNDKLPKFGGKTENIEDLAGFIKIDKEIDGVEIKKQIHMKEDLY
jgi:hypothetical protein